MANTYKSNHKGWMYLYGTCHYNTKLTKNQTFSSSSSQKCCLKLQPHRFWFNLCEVELRTGWLFCTFQGIQMWIQGGEPLFCTTSSEKKVKTLGWISPHLNSRLCQSLSLAMWPCAGYSQNASSSMTRKIQIHQISMRSAFGSICKTFGKVQTYLFSSTSNAFLSLSGPLV